MLPAKSRPAPQIQSGDRRYRNSLELLAAFREQFEALCDADTLRILGNLCSDRFTNADVRALLSSHRQTSWVKLSRLSRAGIIEKRGHSYRVSSYTKEMVVGLSAALANLVALRELSDDPEVSKLFRLASEGIDVLYDRGRLGQEEYMRTKEIMEEVMSKHGIPV
jgi:hypothetical protein